MDARARDPSRLFRRSESARGRGRDHTDGQRVPGAVEMGAAEIPALSKPTRHAGRRAAIHLPLKAPFRQQTFGPARAQKPLYDQPRNAGALRLAVVGNGAEGAADDYGSDYDYRRRGGGVAFLRPASI